ncbi:mechanosensitive ion channel domain-containing protein [Lysobacter sp. A03]|uniref:mechanosensitive ion channel family protein n=1 Tax=Lysobacter sp. A03 TaxID=1199154 RepID=UPI0005B69B47|nr:mechanosensitive ion channel domain-containing protein [Lysobacter sp. A03]KIQ96942.1 Small-conductance mechanosensitive channel [Lysobacter sp. A03]
MTLLTDWTFLEPLEAYPYTFTALQLAGLALAAWLANWLTRVILVRVVTRVVKATPMRWDDALMSPKVLARLANIVPALIIASGIAAITELPSGVETVVRNVALAFVALTIALAMSHVLDAVNQLYVASSSRANERPIKGYLQVVKLVVYVFAVVVIIATLIDRSPLLLLSGFGAMSAVVMLVFKDTILSLVASIQLANNDMLRVGDWIEMPALQADGDVIDMALNTVKVQNWDKTVTTIPTYRLISDSFKNWRGMQESGGRRIKRALLIDQSSVRFLESEERSRLRRIALIDEYLDDKRHELEAYNESLLAKGKDPVNTRRVTNIGTFRAYVYHYLRAHPGIHQDMTLLVRQLEPGATGLPLELYCFTNSVQWAVYENTQSDIFDHLIAMLPEFGLRLYQAPGGADMAALMVSLSRPNDAANAGADTDPDGDVARSVAGVDGDDECTRGGSPPA